MSSRSEEFDICQKGWQGDGRESPVVRYYDFQYEARSWGRPRWVVAKLEQHGGELCPQLGFIATSMSARPEGMVHFHKGRRMSEQWIKEDKYALKM